MGTLRGRNAHKGRTFGGVAACPHCSQAFVYYFTVGRTQCVLDLVSASYSPPYEQSPADVVRALAGTLGVEVVVSDVSGTTGTGVVDAGPGIDVRSDAFPSERGFDDDEAPAPT